jgi:hypothetical protein
MPQRLSVWMLAGVGLLAAGVPAAHAQGSAPRVRVVASPTTAVSGDAIAIYADVTLADDAVGQDVTATYDPIAIGVNKFVGRMAATTYVPGDCPARHTCFAKQGLFTDVYTTPGPHTIPVTVTDVHGRIGTGSVTITFRPPADNDGDGLPDVWEYAYHLNPNSASGNDGADGDPDGDGVTNLQEFRAHTNPVARYTRVFAEGSYGDRQLLTNCYSLSPWEPAGKPDGGDFDTLPIRVLGIGDNGRTFEYHFTIDQNQICPFGSSSGPGNPGFIADRVVAVVFESVTQVAVERITGTLPSRDSRTTIVRNTSLGVQSPSRTWYFARGAAGRGIDLFFLAFNPGTEPVDATFSFSGGPGDPPAQLTRTLPPGVRTTIWVNQDLPPAAVYDAATTITATDGIYVERAWRYQAPGRTVPFDSVGRGASATSTTWYFVAGDLSASFDTSFTIMNPSDQSTTVTAQFLRTDVAVPISRAIDLPPHSRSILRPRDLGIGGAAVALTLTTANGIGIVAERTTDGMTGEGPWRQSSLGATSTGTAWTFAQAIPGGVNADGEHQYVIVNTSAVPGRVHLRTGTFAAASDSVADLPAQRVLVLPAPFGSLWAVVSSEATTGGRAPDIVVERASYVTIDGLARARQVTIVGNVTR